MKNTLLELGTGIACQTLLVTDNKEELNVFWHETLQALRHHCTYTNFSQWQNAFNAEMIELVLVDGSTQPEEAMELCLEFCLLYPSTPLVAILSRHDLSEHGSEWHKAGAQDFLRLDATYVEVQTVLTGELKVARLKKELATLKSQIFNSHQYDPATRFLTRRYFFFNAHRECARARRYGHALSCIMININYYDEYSKNFGQPCSTYVLRSVSTLIRQSIRESDIVARFGPNKMVALLPETDISGAIMVRERIIEATERNEFEWNGETLPVSISIGEAERSHAFDSQLPDIDSPTPISVREEIAQLLEDSDTALTVAQKSSQRPEMFIEYSHAEIPVDG